MCPKAGFAFALQLPWLGDLGQVTFPLWFALACCKKEAFQWASSLSGVSPVTFDFSC